MSIIGQALTVLLPVVKMLNTIVAALINMANAFNAVISSIFGETQKQIQATGAAIEGRTRNRIQHRNRGCRRARAG